MATIPQVSKEMQEILTPVADRLGWQTRFQQRTSKMTGSTFVQSLVFGSLADTELSYTQLCANALDAGVAITPQGLEQRFGPESAQLCQQVLARSLQVVFHGDGLSIPILERFNGIYLRDSSVVSLPAELHDLWPGVGGTAGESSAVKLQVCLEYVHGQVSGPILQAGRVADSNSPYQSEALPRGAVRMGDLGFYSLEQFQADQDQGVFTFSRYKIGTILMDREGQKIDLLPWLRSQSADQLERAVFLGKQARFACRLLVERVPPAAAEKRKRKLQEYARKKQVPVSAELLALAEWTLIITDIPAKLLSIPEAMVLLRVRWQIELLFKRWKSIFHIDHWRSHQPWRILTELFAKLLAVVLLNWIFLLDGWQRPYRSFWKAALIVRRFACALLMALPNLSLLALVLSSLLNHFKHICRLTMRKSDPGTEQRLRALSPSPGRTLA